MGTPSEWIELATEIKAAEDPWSCQAVVRLFALAEEDGRKALRSFAAKLGDDVILDTIRSCMTESLSSIVKADEPRGYFWMCVTRAAISLVRKRSTRVEETPEHEAVAPEKLASTENERIERIDSAAAWARLSPKEQEILSAVVHGADREELARLWGTSRANIDQIVSRARGRLTGEDA